MPSIAEAHTTQELSQELTRGMLVKVIQQDLVRNLEVITRHEAQASATQDEQLAAQWRYSCSEELESFSQLASLLYHLDPAITDSFFNRHADSVKAIERLGLDFEILTNKTMFF